MDNVIQSSMDLTGMPGGTGGLGMGVRRTYRPFGNIPNEEAAITTTENYLKGKTIEERQAFADDLRARIESVTSGEAQKYLRAQRGRRFREAEAPLEELQAMLKTTLKSGVK